MFARKLFAGVLLAGLVFSQLTVSAAAAKACNQAQFISDLTVPDGTSYTVGTAFTKTWRLMNVGSCAWTTSYSLVFFNGESLDRVEWHRSLLGGYQCIGHQRRHL
jgi:hypothetical protein